MLLDKIRQDAKRYGLASKGDKVVVGVSGGPDSIALLHILNSLKKDFSLTLHVAHVDHMLRRSSGSDAAFVKKTAHNLGIPVTVKRLDIGAMARKGSLEEFARRARLDFFFDLAKRIKADKIALGHTLDDQAETVLMRILRGTGLYGLAGILPKRDIAGFQFIRPLLGVRRKDVASFLKRKKIPFRLDPSNRQDIYFRNKIRNRLLPLLEQGYSPNIKELLANMAESAGYDYDYLLRAAQKAMQRAKSRIRLDRLKKMHPALRRVALRMMVSGLKGDTRRMSFRHIIELEELIFNRPLNSIVDLPAGVSAIKKKNSISFYRR